MNCYCTRMQEIEKAAERGDLTELVLIVIWNRLDVARRDVCKISLLVVIYRLYGLFILITVQSSYILEFKRFS